MKRRNYRGKSSGYRPNFLLVIAVVLLFTALGRLGALTLARNASQVAATPLVASTDDARAPVIGTSPSVTTSCTPDNGNVLPQALDLTTVPSGLTQQVDQPYYYHVFGTSADEVRQQIISCAPAQTGGEYTGYTAYNLSWRYDLHDDGDHCSLVNLKLGLHVREVLPAWGSATSSTAAFAATWQHFAAALAVHEQGHVVLDEQSGAQTLADLENLSAPDCGTLKDLVNNTARRDVADLDQANANYDARTDHGATQGAILP